MRFVFFILFVAAVGTAIVTAVKDGIVYIKAKAQQQLKDKYAEEDKGFFGNDE